MDMFNEDGSAKTTLSMINEVEAGIGRCRAELAAMPRIAREISQSKLPDKDRRLQALAARRDVVAKKLQEQLKLLEQFRHNTLSRLFPEEW